MMPVQNAAASLPSSSGFLNTLIFICFPSKHPSL
jgi:hypothetical protein